MTGKAGHNPDKRHLSKSILQMKFMSRSNGDDELNAASSNRDTQWIVDSGGAPERNIVIDESYMKLEDLCEIGRITSKQFNPYIEKLLAEKNRLKDADDKSDEEVEEMDGVTASEMSSRYNSLVSNSKKRAPGLGEDSSDDEELVETNKERRKFLKPA